MELTSLLNDIVKVSEKAACVARAVRWLQFWVVCRDITRNGFVDRSKTNKVAKKHALQTFVF